MNPLALRVLMGLEDNRLLFLFAEMERLPNRSEGEERLMDVIWQRIDKLTDPNFTPADLSEPVATKLAEALRK